MIPPLVIRADAGGVLGTGHIMRMIALAQAYQNRGGRAVMASAQCPQSMIDRVEELGIEHHLFTECELGHTQDAASTVKLCKKLDAQWVVLDGYHFAESYQRQIKDHGIKVLAIDDYGHCSTWFCDAVLNQNLGAENWGRTDSNLSDTQWLFGSSYALIREEFFQSIQASKEKPFPAQRILVTLGGADQDNVSLLVLQSLENTTLQDLKIRLLVGGANPHQKQLEMFAQTSRHHIEILCNVRDMPSMYQWTDAVISAGGSTCWEWLAYGLRGAVITIAENQEPISSELHTQTLALTLGWHTQFDLNSWSRQLESWLKGEQPGSSFEERRQLIDGHGAARAAALLDNGVWSRPAQRNDAKTYFDWANDPAVRSNGFHTEKLEWENHCRWFQKMMQSPDCHLYLVSDVSDNKVGQVRLTPDPSGYLEIGFSVDPAFRKKGLGLILLQHVLTTETSKHPNTRGFIARVKQTNKASARIFQLLDFQPDDDDPKLGCLVYLKKTN